jgi:hypothetical protein
MQLITVNAISCGLPPLIIIEWLSCIRIHVKARKVAAGNVEADSMTTLEDQRETSVTVREFACASW